MQIYATKIWTKTVYERSADARWSSIWLGAKKILTSQRMHESEPSQHPLFLWFELSA